MVKDILQLNNFRRTVAFMGLRRHRRPQAETIPITLPDQCQIVHKRTIGLLARQWGHKFKAGLAEVGIRPGMRHRQIPHIGAEISVIAVRPQGLVHVSAERMIPVGPDLSVSVRQVRDGTVCGKSDFIRTAELGSIRAEGFAPAQV
ncbi:hypothetical protein D3C81_1883660 [compost metagenome]